MKDIPAYSMRGNISLTTVAAIPTTPASSWTMGESSRAHLHGLQGSSGSFVCDAELLARILCVSFDLQG
jgi:hypothetical protein